MKRASSILFCVTLLATLGCGDRTDHADYATEHADDATSHAAHESEGAAVDTTTASATTAAGTVTGDTHETEIGCAHCVYHMDGVDSCKAAVKIGDQIVLLQSDVDPHGLCAKPIKATVTGEMSEGVFVASLVDVAE